MSRIVIGVAVASAGIVSFAQSASAQAFGRMINFGDSLTDVGNTNSITFGISPGSAYYNGRYSNGPVWAEDLAGSLHLPALVASRKGGLDYAVGGSQTGSGSTSGILPNAGTQINSFLASNTLGPNDLVTLWTGANDFLNNTSTNPSVPAANVQAHVQTLINAGAKNILVVNLPPLGETPEYVGTSSRSMMDGIASSFNADLSANLDTVAAASPSVTLYRGDMYALFNTVLANPSSYGFTDITDPALRSDKTVVANPDQYLFWDQIHPTRVGHALISNYALDSVTARTFATPTIGGSGDWNTAATWAQHRVPDSTSAVSLSGAAPVAVSLNGNASVRTLAVGSAATLEVAHGVLSVAGDLSLTGGHLRLDFAAANVPAVVGGVAHLNGIGGGTIGVKFTDGFIGLPGSSLTAMTYASETGSPIIANETGFAGLHFTPTFGSTALSISLSATPGDANLDAGVNFDDLVILAQHYGDVGSQTWLTGDFTHDGNVNFNDLVDLAQNYGATPAGFEADWALAESVTPEPTAMLAAAASLIVMRRRRA